MVATAEPTYPPDLRVVSPAPPTLPALVAKVAAIEAEMNAAIVDRADAIRACLVALVAGEHVVLLGPPGASKSHIVTMLADRVAASSGGATRFEWQCNKFTLPEELFGPISVQGLKRDEYKRVTAGKLPDAHFVLLDECFKASGALQNALLLIMNERQYDNGGVREPVPLLTLFGASNEMPEAAESAASWDRYLLRLTVEYVDESGFAKLLRLSRPATPPTVLALAELAVLQAARERVTVPDAVLDQLARLRAEMRTKGIIASDRRWLQSLTALRAHALIAGRMSVEEDDLTVLGHILWQTPEQASEIARCVARVSNPVNAKAVELGDAAASIVKAAIDKRADPQLNAGQKMESVIDALAKMSEITTELGTLRANVVASAGNTAKIDKVLSEIQTRQGEFLRLATGA